MCAAFTAEGSIINQGKFLLMSFFDLFKLFTDIHTNQMMHNINRRDVDDNGFKCVWC